MSSLTPEVLVRAYRAGIFPMGDAEDDAIRWYAPDPRGVLPLDAFHVPKTLDQLVQKQPFKVASDQDFEAVIHACADRERTWITNEIIDAYCALHERGLAHSIECRQDGKLTGGLYGVALGGAFFGESMFYRERDASKVALVHLVQHLRAGSFRLLDVQYVTPHLEQFGAVEIPRSEYERRLAHALATDAAW